MRCGTPLRLGEAAARWPPASPGRRRGSLRARARLRIPFLAHACLAAWFWGAAAVDCFEADITRQDCCVEPPRRSDCWLPELGITWENCCRKKGKRNPAQLWEGFESLYGFTAATANALQSLDTGSVDGCLHSTRHFFGAIPEEDSGPTQEWWARHLEQDFPWMLRRCRNQGAVLRLEQSLMEAILRAWSMQEVNCERLLLHWQNVTMRLKHRLKMASAARWASAERTARAAVQPVRVSRSLTPAVQWYVRNAKVEPVHIAMLASVGKPPFGRKALAGVRSALFFARLRPLHFHLLVDRAGEADMLRALDTLEPWLRARGHFELYRVETLKTAWQRVRDLIPQSCLKFTDHYGSPGFLRLFAPDIISGAGVRVVTWVDAGDYVFLDDPAVLLQYHSQFKPRNVLAAPESHPLPFQLFDLDRMRRANWSELVAEAFREGYAESGDKFCNLGEGKVVGWLATQPKYGHLWHWFPGTWAFEPWSEWLPSIGLIDHWTERDARLNIVWQDRIFSGVHDFMTVEVFCPDFQETLVQHVLFSGIDAAEISVGVRMAKHYHELRTGNSTYKDWKGQLLKCQQRASGMHLVLPFHDIPWAHRFLNFWVGADVWNKDWRKGRNLQL